MDRFDSFLLGLFVGLIIAILVAVIVGEVSYQKAQIDALTGKVKYHLVTKPDSTRVWEEIEKEKE